MFSANCYLSERLGFLPAVPWLPWWWLQQALLPGDAQKCLMGPKLLWEKGEQLGHKLSVLASPTSNDVPPVALQTKLPGCAQCLLLM